ncbi:bifunctional UDP-3-O-[3-hydroxymyristoyl] N-acetylglucosamine deacetylase/3-hydroxyacyl-ACP dehydratase [Opitutia bacterium ISCC 51]|nr:bifunctional UDP-3-O-[3-hydroxymyristoyl] N-acetylglucosamine deacetylase/3-hydroxyacyl-ACP dehydratase [Opitutae bacterium ISCC 51]QXD28731.1 bifunctional UDP-3-O-[3-hydroxymyristoyl] N-acetylglucosamine deacetylase/3-hydroxyacyl-ACP dehydratase [Opitutae bacterium ISCC 52]
MKQRSILREVTAKGKAVHTGEEVSLTIKPAPVDHGVVFRRVDLYGKPEVKASIGSVSEVVRSTTVSDGYTKIEMTEHLLSVLNGMGVDNILVEVDGNELPVFDGSAKEYLNMIQEAEPVEQDKDREYFVLKEPISVSNGNRSLVALPYDGFKVTCTSTDQKAVHTQHLSIDIDPDTYATQIAAARTFTIYEEIEPLLKMGKIKGGSLDCAVVIKGDKILSKEPLRFPDEMVRHKILDIIGDIFLLGKPIKTHIVALIPGHALNAKLTQALYEKMIEEAEPPKKKAPEKKASPKVDISDVTELNIQQLLNLLPHRYPFLMVDRVIEIKDDNTELTAIKNVTVNEPHFTGHYPGNPIMPGVLQIEAMAQVAGVLMLLRCGGEGKIPLFINADKVKLRKIVTPGDQLIIEAKILKLRGNKIGSAEARCKVNGAVVSSMEMMFALVDEDDS